MQEFLLILKGDGMSTLSPDEIQELFLAYKTWVKNLGDQYITGQRLQNSGTVLIQKGEILTDGPFLEPKEMIAGYFLIRAKDQEEANTIASLSPHLGLYSIEVRPLIQPTMH